MIFDFRAEVRRELVDGREVSVIRYEYGQRRTLPWERAKRSVVASPERPAGDDGPGAARRWFHFPELGVEGCRSLDEAMNSILPKELAFAELTAHGHDPRDFEAAEGIRRYYHGRSVLEWIGGA